MLKTLKKNLFYTSQVITPWIGCTPYIFIPLRAQKETPIFTLNVKGVITRIMCDYLVDYVFM